MEFIDKNTIKLGKELTELDKEVLRFVEILKKHVDYVIISGYISILLGRSRGTEDVDVFIKEVPRESIKNLSNDLKKHSYWCLNTDNVSEMYSYLKDGLAVRFAIKNQTIPNFEVKFAKKIIQQAAFNDSIKVDTGKGIILISSLERHIAFKKYYLRSDKDMEDARHIEEMFKKHINNGRIKEYRRIIENEMA